MARSHVGLPRATPTLVLKSDLLRLLKRLDADPPGVQRVLALETDFRRRKNEVIYRIATKKPVVADEDERRTNPRSRSAKLRVAVRLASG